MHCVIGTGPSAATAARVLAKRGLEVCIVDPSFGPGEATRELTTRMCQSEPGDWAPQDVTALKANMQASGDGIPRKLVYGSDFPYRQVAGAPPVELVDAEMLRSFAEAGLSNVWGACILPYPDAELSDWPVALGEMQEHYRSVLASIPFSGADDALSELFPHSPSPTQPAVTSPQCETLLADLSRKERSLRRKGIRFGAARLAVTTDMEGRFCRRCGLCLYGCPYRLIYSASQTLEPLRSAENVVFKRGLWVHSVEQRVSGVRINARRCDNGEAVTIEADKAYLGAGVVESTRILLQSLAAFDEPLIGLHSDRFVLPLIRLQKSRGIANDPLHTMAQVFLEIQDSNLCDELVHVQLYGYNELFRQAIDDKLGGLKRWVGPLAEAILLERLMVGFGYLHSKRSAKLEFRLERDGHLRIRGVRVAETQKLCRAVVAKLRAAGVGFRTFVGGANVAAPGGGNHSGGTFPMAATPGRFQSSASGVPSGFRDLHVVDASVLPSLSATTITLTAMANASRIASRALTESQ